jgi:1,4-alpha-glucan branching enzyme
VHLGGLGFDLKWSMGWMHDSLDYFGFDPIHRSQHHERLTFSMLYAFSENFLLPISHDEVVHGKGSLINKQWGDESEKFAGLRLFLTYMYAHPGKKLLFMGCEFGQWKEWDWSQALDWSLLEKPAHSQVQSYVRELNRFHRLEGALHEQDFNWEGFEWVDLNDDRQSVISFLRKGADGSDPILAVFNFTPVARHDYRLGIPNAEHYEEVLNSDSRLWGGSNMGNLGRVAVEAQACHRRSHSIVLTLPPLTAILLKPVL